MKRPLERPYSFLGLDPGTRLLKPRPCKPTRGPRAGSRMPEGLATRQPVSERFLMRAYPVQHGGNRPKKNAEIGCQTPRANVESIQLCPLFIVDIAPPRNLP